MTPRTNLLYIASTNRSGSTLLDQLLGSHSNAVSVGELRRLGEFWRDNLSCTCGAPVRQCEFWMAVAAQGSLDVATSAADRRRLAFLPNSVEVAALVRPVRMVLGRSGRAAARNSWRVADSIAAISGNKVVVDSSKRADQLVFLQEHRPDHLKALLLTRDGRGVALSQSLRSNITFKAATYSWIRRTISLLAAMKHVPKGRQHILRYEDLCTNPDGTLNTIAAWADLGTRGSTSAASYHNIGGSPHRFDFGKAAMVVDERWKRDLTTRDLKFFNRVAGWLNRRLGYE